MNHPVKPSLTLHNVTLTFPAPHVIKPQRHSLLVAGDRVARLPQHLRAVETVFVALEKPVPIVLPTAAPVVEMVAVVVAKPVQIVLPIVAAARQRVETQSAQAERPAATAREIAVYALIPAILLHLPMDQRPGAVMDHVVPEKTVPTVHQIVVIAR